MNALLNDVDRTAVLAGAECTLETVLRCVGEGRLDEAVNQFNDRFTFNDNGIQLEFSDKERLREFFQKTREAYSGFAIETEAIRQIRDELIGEWTLRATVTEPFFGGMQRKTPIVLRGVSVVRFENGKITQWSDYYDGLSSRRSAVAAFFTDWIEL
jgi:hypothetical protein